MKAYVNRKEVGYGFLISIPAIIAFFAVGIQPALYAEQQQQTSPGKAQTSSNDSIVEERNEKSAVTPGGEAAIRVYIDPKTGKTGPPPPGELPPELPSQLMEALSTSSEGLVETPSPTPGGGFMIDLKGRFHAPLTATQDADGKVSIQHLPKEPGSTKNE